MLSTSTYLLSALVALAAAQGTTPPKTYADCKDVVVFYSRGNDAPYHDDRVSGYIAEICNKFEGLKYSCDYIDIVFNATYGGDFCAQVAEGAANGISEITNFNARCPNTKIVINGYSQGANVAGDVLGGPGGCSEVSTGIDPSSQAGQAISAVTVFGDVRHTADQPYNVLDGASKSGGFVRTGDDLARLNRYSDVLRSYCAAGDPVCAGGKDVAYHLNYFELHADEASDWIVNKVVPLLKKVVASTSSSVVASSTSAVSSSTTTSSVSVAATTSTAAVVTANNTTSLHQIPYITNSSLAAQPTSYSSSAVIVTLVDTDNTTTSASSNHGWNHTATSYSSQPVTTVVTIDGSSSASHSNSPSTAGVHVPGSSSPALESYASQSSAPTAAPVVSVTEIVTAYTTVCPAESTYASEGQQRTTTYDYLVTSTRVSTFWTTVTASLATPTEAAHPGFYQPEHPQQTQPQQWGHQGQQPQDEHPVTTVPAETTTTDLSAGQRCIETLTSVVTYTSTVIEHVTSTFLASATLEPSSLVVPYPVGNQTEPMASSASPSRTTFLGSTLQTVHARPTAYYN